MCVYVPLRVCVRAPLCVEATLGIGCLDRLARDCTEWDGGVPPPPVGLQKKLRERHGRMEDMRLYKESPTAACELTNEMLTLEQVGVEGREKNEVPPLVCAVPSGHLLPRWMWLGPVIHPVVHTRTHTRCPFTPQVVTLWYDFKPHHHDDPLLLALHPR